MVNTSPSADEVKAPGPFFTHYLCDHEATKAARQACRRRAARKAKSHAEQG